MAGVQPGQQQQQVGPLGVAVQADLAAVREIEALRDAFTGGPTHPRYRLATLLLNVVDDPAARQKPAGAPPPLPPPRPHAPLPCLTWHFSGTASSDRCDVPQLIGGITWARTQPVITFAKRRQLLCMG